MGDKCPSEITFVYVHVFVCHWGKKNNNKIKFSHKRNIVTLDSKQQTEKPCELVLLHPSVYVSFKGVEQEECAIAEYFSFRIH